MAEVLLHIVALDFRRPHITINIWARLNKRLSLPPAYFLLVLLVEVSLPFLSVWDGDLESPRGLWRAGHETRREDPVEGLDHGLGQLNQGF